MLKGLISDSADGDRAVSPVIGVILMVAITVILATVIGAVVLDFGNNAGDSSPSASLEVEATDDSANTVDDVTIEHTGGDSLNLDQTKVLISDGSNQIEFLAGSNGITFSVGETGVLETASASDVAGDFVENNNDGFDDSSTGTLDFESGDQITITVIDTESQREILETTVTAQ
jgi:flagellin-like protein